MLQPFGARLAVANGENRKPGLNDTMTLEAMAAQKPTQVNLNCVTPAPEMPQTLKATQTHLDHLRLQRSFSRRGDNNASNNQQQAEPSASGERSQL